MRHQDHAAREGREVAALAALIMGPEGGFITGSDFLIDGENRARQQPASVGCGADRLLNQRRSN